MAMILVSILSKHPSTLNNNTSSNILFNQKRFEILLIF